MGSYAIRKEQEPFIKPDSHYAVTDEWQNIISTEPKFMVE